MGAAVGKTVIVGEGAGAPINAIVRSVLTPPAERATPNPPRPSPGRGLGATIGDSSFEAIARVQTRHVTVEIGRHCSRRFVTADEPRIYSAN